mmetsp:Transcript_43686/g.120939  ORF Transcript_43686/g.120939 Transcript_43686/m.120939 type:complete len:307 (-) Transcript_43686:145-1065(-)
MSPFWELGDPGLKDYVLALVPLVLALLAVPTLEEAKRGELLWPRPVVLEPGEVWRAQRQMSLTDAGLRQGRWWTLVSYMFLHQDEAHLIGNLMTLGASGREVYRAVGGLGLYGVFLLTGVAAGANRWGRIHQMEAQLVGSTPQIPKSLDDWLPDRLRSAVGEGIARIAKSSAPIVSELAADLGASGGACGVMGFSFGLAIECLVLGLTHGSKRTPINNGFACLVLLDSGRFLAMEWKQLCGEDGLTGVGHAAHLTGFAAGLGLLGIFRGLELLASAFPSPSDRPGRDSPRERRQGRRYVDDLGNLR